MDNVEIKDMKKTLFRLWGYLKYQKIKLIFVIIIVLVSTVLSIVSPLFMQIAIDKFILNNKLKPLFYLLLILLIIYIFKSIITWISNLVMAYISEKTLYILRRDLFAKLEKLDISFFDKNKNGDLMSHFTNDISAISDALTETIIEIIGSIIIIIGTLITMFMVNYILAIIVVITVPIFFIIVMQIGKKASNFFLLEQTLLGDLTGVSEELISGIKVLKSLNEEENINIKFEQKSKKLSDIFIKSQVYSGFIMPLNSVISNIGNILLLLVGSILVLNNQATIGIILSFLTYSAMFRGPINSIAGLFANIGSALAGAERVFSVIDEPILVKNRKNSLGVSKLKGNVKFDNVSFGYTDKVILSDINIDVKKGQMIAIVGKTGAGKTTIANLLNRFYDINKGSILIDDISINDYSVDDLRKRIGVVLQDTYLFKGTVKDNIMYGGGLSEKKMIEASKKANAHTFIHRLPDGYNTLVEDGGNNFSEGEKQLIAIARIILSDPDILILDEATSKIDTKTELSIQKGMKELMKGKTSFVIAHRLSTIKESDLILVIDDGKIVESGTHNYLLNKRGFYCQLYMSQFEN